MSDGDPNCKDAQFAHYRYDPNTGAAVFFGMLLSVSTILYMWQTIQPKTYRPNSVIQFIIMNPVACYS
ncbi:hypothetical protein BN1723_002703 [Verticillium longisporum]|uniref:Uncharacterized protein n=1 Tax=Verticillium longisporum TaxID=100787 RepID=A0A0G4LFD2_VERLO|nr:hypothetical protein BN1723_002703 [Verticillium longisporum]